MQRLVILPVFIFGEFVPFLGEINFRVAKIDIGRNFDLVKMVETAIIKIHSLQKWQYSNF